MKTPTIIILPYKTYSESAKLLKHEISIRGYPCKIASENRNYLVSPSDSVINWGNARWPKWLSPKDNILNAPHKVNDACNKITTFELLKLSKKVSVPVWTTSIEKAIQWNSNGVPLVVRKKIKSSGGDGIVVINPYLPKTIPEAPLYVKYISKKYEFRVHVFKGSVVDIQQKRRNTEVDIVDYQIRSYGNGWVFHRENLAPEANILALHEMAIAAINSLGLDFGAVDIIYNSLQGLFYVLEVNTAPGLQGQTIHTYADEITKHFLNG